MVKNSTLRGKKGVAWRWGGRGEATGEKLEGGGGGGMGGLPLS